MADDRADLGKELTGDFLDHFREHEDSITSVERRIRSTPLLVLILGVTDDGSLHSKKRIQIKQELNRLPGVSAWFPEDQEIQSLAVKRLSAPDWEQDPRLHELIQFKLADAIVALEPGPGVDQEVAIITGHTDLTEKLIDLLPEHYRATTDSSFAGLLRKRANARVKHYTPEQLEECVVATVAAPELVQQKQTEKWIRLAG